MKITKWQDSKQVKNVHEVDVRLMYNKKDAQASIITLKPGQNLKPHITPVDVFFYIIEGKPTILLGKEKQTVDADCVIESPKDIVHSIYNESDSIVKVLVVKTPKPTSSTRVL